MLSKRLSVDTQRDLCFGRASMLPFERRAAASGLRLAALELGNLVVAVKESSAAVQCKRRALCASSAAIQRERRALRAAGASSILRDSHRAAAARAEEPLSPPPPSERITCCNSKVFEL